MSKKSAGAKIPAPFPTTQAPEALLVVGARRDAEVAVYGLDRPIVEQRLDGPDVALGDYGLLGCAPGCPADYVSGEGIAFNHAGERPALTIGTKILFAQKAWAKWKSSFLKEATSRRDPKVNGSTDSVLIDQPPYLARWAFRFCLLFCCGFFVSACSFVTHASPRFPLLSAANPVSIDGDLSLSPDGRFVAFRFVVLSPADGPVNAGVGLYEWRTGKAIRIPNPPGFRLDEPSFSHDGKRLAVLIHPQVNVDLVIANRLDVPRSEIGIVDIDTMKVTQVTRPEKKLPGLANTNHFISFPIFQPGDENIAFIYGVGPCSIRLVNISSGVETDVFSQSEGFSSIFNKNFISKDELYFSAMAPKSKSLADKISSDGFSSVEVMIYRVKIGGIPDFVLYNTQLNNRFSQSYANMRDLTISSGGETIVFIKHSDNLRGPFRFNLFEIEKSGGQRQLTDLDTVLQHAAISDDGSTVAVLSDPGRVRRGDLDVLDLRTGQLIDTNLLKKLASDPNFMTGPVTP